MARARAKARVGARVRGRLRVGVRPWRLGLGLEGWVERGEGLV